MEAIFESVEGVSEAVSGYAGGFTENPTYQSIGTGKTGHAEAVAVYYNPKLVSFQTLVDVFFELLKIQKGWPQTQLTKKILAW